MKKAFKILIIIGSALLFAGASFFTIGFGLTGWNAEALGNTQIVEKVYTEPTTASIDAVSLDFDVADVDVIFNDALDNVTVTYPQRQNRRGKNLSDVRIIELDHSVSITERETFFFPVIDFDFTAPKVTVELPADREYSLSVKTDTGDVCVQGAGTIKSFYIVTDTGEVDTQQANLTKATTQGSLTIKVDTGRIKLGDFYLDKVTVETDTGDIYTQNGTALQQLSLSNDTGDMQIKGVLSSAQISLSNDTGDIATEENGKIDGMTVIISNDTGDVEIMLAGKHSDYIMTVEHDIGDTNLHSSHPGDTPATEEARILKIEVDVGDIEVSFSE